MLALRKKIENRNKDVQMKETGVFGVGVVDGVCVRRNSPVREQRDCCFEAIAWFKARVGGLG